RIESPKSDIECHLSFDFDYFLNIYNYYFTYFLTKNFEEQGFLALTIIIYLIAK
ncbi:hypothetical protein GASC598P17_003020, partial [Gilliamella apis SCGC AB-598-P17]